MRRANSWRITWGRKRPSESAMITQAKRRRLASESQAKRLRGNRQHGGGRQSARPAQGERRREGTWGEPRSVENVEPRRARFNPGSQASCSKDSASLISPCPSRARLSKSLEACQRGGSMEKGIVTRRSVRIGHPALKPTPFISLMNVASLWLCSGGLSTGGIADFTRFSGRRNGRERTGFFAVCFACGETPRAA